MREVWGWDGSDHLILNKFKDCKEGCFIKLRKRCYQLKKTIRKYELPKKSVQKYLIDHGVKWWVIGEEKIPVKKVAGKGYVCVTV